jgi:hypothetical protein
MTPRLAFIALSVLVPLPHISGDHEAKRIPR